jgi:hypothetical protein
MMEIILRFLAIWQPCLSETENVEYKLSEQLEVNIFLGWSPPLPHATKSRPLQPDRGRLSDVRRQTLKNCIA